MTTSRATEDVVITDHGAELPARVGNLSLDISRKDILSSELVNTLLAASDEYNTEDKEIIPPALRGVRKSVNASVYIFEKPPHTKTLDYSPYMKQSVEDTGLTFKGAVKMPWTIYSVQVNRMGDVVKVYVYFAIEQVTNGLAKIRPAILPNIYEEGLVCQGEYYPRAKSISEVFSMAYNLVWNFGFNSDLTENLYVAKDLKWPSEKLWSEAMRLDTIIEQWQYVMANAKFEQVLDHELWDLVHKSHQRYNTGMRFGDLLNSDASSSKVTMLRTSVVQSLMAVKS